MSRKIIDTKATIVIEANQLQIYYRVAKVLKIIEKYEVELAILNAEYSSPLLKTLSSYLLNTLLDPDILQL